MSEQSNHPVKRPLVAENGGARPMTRPAGSERDEPPVEVAEQTRRAEADPPGVAAAGETRHRTPEDERLEDRPTAPAAGADGGEPEAAPPSATRPISDDGMSDPQADRQPDPGAPDADEAEPGGPAAASVGKPAPAASLLETPLFIPASVPFEDLPHDAQSPIRPAARPPAGEARSPEAEDPGRPAPRSEMPPRSATPTGQTESKTDRRPRASLAAWMQAGRSTARTPRSRWPAVAGGLAVVVALIAFLAASLIPPPQEDGQGIEVARQTGSPDSPAATADEGPADGQSSASATPQKPPIAPAESEALAEQSATAAPARTEPATPAESPWLAAPPHAAGAPPAGGTQEPVVEIARIDPDGMAMIAGRAEPETELVILDNGVPIGSTRANILGHWLYRSDAPLPAGKHEIALAVRSTATAPAAPAPLPDSAATGEAAAAAPMNEPRGEETADPVGDGQLPAVTAPDVETASAPGEPGGSSGAAPEPDPLTAPAVAAAGAAPTSAPPQPVAKPSRASGTAVASATPGGGDYVIQLASLSSADRAARAQTQLQRRFSDLLTGFELFVEQARLTDRGTVYRVRTGPFDSLAAARDACARFQARRHDCLVVRR